jgi:hypothetical protein
MRAGITAFLEGVVGQFGFSNLPILALKGVAAAISRGALARYISRKSSLQQT